MQTKSRKFEIIVDKQPKDWLEQFITGAEILTLAGSPSDWIVNAKVPGPGEDPVVLSDQKVDLSLEAEPKGVKRFTTRKPATTPGS